MLSLLLVSILADTPKAERPQPPLIRLAPQATAKPPSALHYRLLTNSADLIVGNAAPFWHKAVSAERDVPHKITQEEYRWAESDFPLRDLPRPKVQAFVARYNNALRMARQASLRDHCDWQQPLVTLQNMGDLPLPNIQSLRQIAFILGIQCRLQLSERRFEDVADTLRTGFALARHIAEGNTIIESLVGVSTAQLMLARIEEWIALADSPNLYWPLSALPQPLIDMRRVLELELDTVYRWFPQLRELQKSTLTRRQAEGMIEGLFRKISGSPSPQDLKQKSWVVQRKLFLAFLAAQVYPEGRQALLDKGRPAQEVDAMPIAQVALIYLLDEVDRVRDDIVKWLALPSGQALAGLMQVAEEVRQVRPSNLIVGYFFPSFPSIFAARVRIEQNIAALRGAEALRLYASAHEGRPPAKWSDITAVPRPINPATGEGFDAFYEVKDGRALLNVPPVAGQPISTGRRFEWLLKR